MKVIHLSTTTEGGAGKAAFRIFQSQIKFGIDSTLVTRSQIITADLVTNLRRNSLAKIILSKVITFTLQKISLKEYGILTIYSTSFLDRKYFKKMNPDIINIHNWFNFLSPNDLEWLIAQYNCVFTLHDERLLTAGCHYSLGCNNWETKCVRCPQSRINVRSLEKSGDELTRIFTREWVKFGVISPSRWLLHRASKSRMGANLNLMKVIKNPMDESFYYSSSNQEARHKGRITFIASDLNNPNKGLSVLVQAIRRLKRENPDLNLELELIGLGNVDQSITTDIPTRIFASLNTSQIFERLSTTDVLVVPSIIDNSPSVIAEGQLAGALVVASAVGGIPELIEEEISGFLYKGGPDQLATVLTKALELRDSEEFRLKVKTDIRESLSWKNLASETVELYLRVLSFTD
jgi:glycosyltransferase involved in cell wall biosynthesis